MEGGVPDWRELWEKYTSIDVVNFIRKHELDSKKRDPIDYRSNTLLDESFRDSGCTIHLF